jgi:amino acid adenylation domain-containing protein
VPAPGNDFRPFDRAHLDRSIPERFERQVELHGGRPAIREGDETLTYAELNVRANRLARAILALGPATDLPVALLVDQGAAYVTALLGTLKAGHFFAPLDPRNPDARNRTMLEDSRAAVLVASHQHAARGRALAGDLRILDLDGIDRTLPGNDLARKPGADSLAYVLYTSGSTGAPKGVMQDHRNVLHNTLRHTNAFHLAPKDRLSLFYPCSVYGGVRDIFLALLNGASLHRYAIESAGVAHLAEWLIRSEISVYCSVATIFRQFARTLTDERFPALRLMKLGGEAVYKTDLELFQRHFPEGCLLSCGLASTEVGGVRQHFLDGSSRVESSRVPCGGPVEDMEVLILDEGGRELPPGEPGEIAVRSPYVALGYWRQAGLTDRSFRSEADGRRTYRMGDLGRLEADGQLIHMGRKDRQIKIRGNRIEIPEVEVALQRFPPLEEVAVTAVPRGAAAAGVTRDP